MKQSPSRSSSRQRRSVSRAGSIRIPKIHALLVDHRRKWLRNSNTPLWNYKTIGAELETSWTNIRDDIRHMRDQLGYPITFIPAKHGHMYLQDFTPISTELLTPGDLTTLCFMMRAMEPFRQNPEYRKKIRFAITKISATLREELGISFRDLEKAVTFRSIGFDAHMDPDIFETVFAAVLGRQELQIDYVKLHQEEEAVGGEDRRGGGGESRGMESGEHATNATEDKQQKARDDRGGGADKGRLETGERPTPAKLHTANCSLPTAHFPLPLPAPERRIVEPLHLLCFDNVWYLYVWDPLRKDIRRFALNRMQSAERTGRSIKRRKFDIEKELADTLGVTSGTPQSVRLRFKGKAARIVTERYWHESQQFTAGPSPEWPLEFALRVAHTPELESFVRQFGDDVEVIEPATLHEAVVKEARCVVARGKAA